MIFILLVALLEVVFPVAPGESIQNALDQATAQDTVLLLPGMHSGTGDHLAVITGEQNGVILLGSPQSPSSVILDGGSLDQCILLVDGASAGSVGLSTIIRGITFSNGNSGTYPFGGGIRLHNASPSVDLCIFDNCEAENGGGVYIWKGEPFLAGCIFEDCQSESAGAGLYLYNSSSTIRNCRFLRCSSSDDGGGIYLYHSSPEIHNCLFSDGWANDDGASIYCYTLSFPDVGFCTFTGCNVYGDGAAVYFRILCGGTIHDNIIANNSTTGFFEKGGADPYFSHNCVWNNVGKNYGNLPDPTGQDGNIEQDPLLIIDWYLSCIAAGQHLQSPCINTGSIEAQVAGLTLFWTRTDSIFDTGTSDMGFHHGPPSEWLSIENHIADPLPSLVASPSPTYGRLILYCGGDCLEGAQVIDMTGRVVCSTGSPAEEVQLNLPVDLPSGVYLARAKVHGYWLTVKFVLMNR